MTDRAPARLAAGILLAGIFGCGDDTREDRPAPPTNDRPAFRLHEALSAGIDFQHDHGGFGRKHFVEINTGGVALLDYDGDGLLDVFLCQGEYLPGHPREGQALGDRLYRNLGGFRFEDVTEATGAGDDSYTFSASCPDFDGDGDPDLYLCNYGPNRLLENRDGVFHDVTEASGLGGDEWSSAACFADFDGDGDLECYVTNYIVYDLGTDVVCGDADKGPEWIAYCHPDAFDGQPDRFLRCDGLVDGAWRWTDITAEAGMSASDGKGLALVPVDYDDDADLDLFVANDATPNFLWRNEGGLNFEEQGFLSGVGLNGVGRSESCMGSDAADVDGDGDFDLLSANMAEETHTLWKNEGNGTFVDDTDFSGLAKDSMPMVGFGAEFLDHDLDGDPDLLVANGHVLDNIALYDPHQSFPQHPQLYENIGAAKFQLIPSERAGSYFSTTVVGRGLAIGDLDDDGDQDVVVAHNGGRPAILENRARTEDGGPHWIGFDLRQSRGNRRAIGAKLTVISARGSQIEEVRGCSSFAAWHDLRLLFGLGEEDTVEEVVVRWPDGQIQRLESPETGRYHRLER